MILFLSCSSVAQVSGLCWRCKCFEKGSGCGTGAYGAAGGISSAGGGTRRGFCGDCCLCRAADIMPYTVSDSAAAVSTAMSIPWCLLMRSCQNFPPLRRCGSRRAGRPRAGPPVRVARCRNCSHLLYETPPRIAADCTLGSRSTAPATAIARTTLTTNVPTMYHMSRTLSRCAVVPMP